MTVPSLMVWSVIPLSEYFVADINAGLLFIHSVHQIQNMHFLDHEMAIQIIAYGLQWVTLIGVLMVAGGLNLQEIVSSQRGGILHWLV